MEEPKLEPTQGAAIPEGAKGGSDGQAIKKGMKTWEQGVALGVVILAGYCFTYLFVMQTQDSEVSTGGPMFTLRRPYFSKDRETEVTLQKIFRPALFIDSKIRPGFWGISPEIQEQGL